MTDQPKISNRIERASPAKTELGWASDELTLSMSGDLELTDRHLDLAIRHVKKAANHLGFDLVKSTEQGRG